LVAQPASPAGRLRADRRQTYPVTAIEATGQEREVLWRQMADLYKGYDGYAKKTTRKIPVVVLHRR
jgi:hypothetical protein